MTLDAHSGPHWADPWNDIWYGPFYNYIELPAVPVPTILFELSGAMSIKSDSGTTYDVTGWNTDGTFDLSGGGTTSYADGAPFDLVSVGTDWAPDNSWQRPYLMLLSDGVGGYNDAQVFFNGTYRGDGIEYTADTVEIGDDFTFIMQVNTRELRSGVDQKYWSIENGRDVSLYINDQGKLGITNKNSSVESTTPVSLDYAEKEWVWVGIRSIGGVAQFIIDTPVDATFPISNYTVTGDLNLANSGSYSNNGMFDLAHAAYFDSGLSAYEITLYENDNLRSTPEPNIQNMVSNDQVGFVHLYDYTIGPAAGFTWSFSDGMDVSTISELSMHPTNKKITVIDIGGSDTTSLLDVRQFEELGSVIFDNTDIEEVLLGNSSNITIVNGQAADLQYISPEGLTNLAALNIIDNDDVGSIDVSSNLLLEELKVTNAGLSSLDVTNNTELTILYAAENTFSSLDVTDLTKLVSFFVNANPNLTALDLSQNTALVTVRAQDNPLVTSLDLSNNANLQTLWCHRGGLTSIDTSGATSLKTLLAYDNPIATNFDFSNNAQRTSIDIGDCGLSQAEVDSVIDDVWQLRATSPTMTRFDIAGNAAPSGVYQAASPPTTGKEKLYDLVENYGYGNVFYTA